MIKLPDHILVALDPNDTDRLDDLIARHAAADFELLLRIASGEVMPTAWARRRALYALGRWGDPGVSRAIEAVLPLLDVNERVAAIDALGQLGTEEAAALAWEFARDPSAEVRGAVVEALARIGGSKTRGLLRLLEASDPSATVRELAKQRSRGTPC